jgi:serine/threonine protein phosphatase PrpC
MEKGINTEWYYDSKAPNCVSEYSYITKNGRQSNKTEKINQDSLFTYENFMMIKNFYFFGVCDGHGVNGHLASKHAKQYIAANLQFLEIEKSVSQEYKEKFENIIKDFEEYIPEKSSSFNNSTIKFIYEKLRLGLHNFSFCKRSSKDLKFNIKNVFFKTHEDIKNTSFISDHSGTTVCSVFILGKNLYCANLGDSRAVIACLEEGKFITYNLSIDHKPDNEEEKKRIISCNGRVEPSRNSFDVFVGPARVWQKNYDTPGLAMSRSIGDCAATKLGVISEPDIFDYTLRKTDKFIIIASDGIWEFITSQKAVEIVIPYFMKNNSAGACNELLSFATSLWKSVIKIIYHLA